MATTMESTQVNIANADDVEMMLVDSSNVTAGTAVDDDDDGEEIKIDDDLDDDMDDDDDLTDDDDDDVVSESGSGRHTPTGGLHHHHHHHHGHNYGGSMEPRIQQHHHHHFHYFYQYPSQTTVNDIHGVHAANDNNNINVANSINLMNDPTSINNHHNNNNNNGSPAGLVRTISNGSMFGPINTNLVPFLQPVNSNGGSNSHRSFHPALINNMNINTNHHHHQSSAAVYNSLSPIFEHQVSSPSEQAVNGGRQDALVHRQQRYQPKPPSPSSMVVAEPTSPPASPDSIGSPSSPSVQSSSQPIFSPTSATSTVNNSNIITNPSTVQPINDTLNQTVISTIDGTVAGVSSSVVASSASVNTGRPVTAPGIVNCHSSYHSYDQISAHHPHHHQQQHQATGQISSPGIKPQPSPVSPTTPQQQPLVSTTAPISSVPTIELPYTFGRSYQLTSQIEASNLYLCIDTVNKLDFCCKVVNSSKYSKFLGPHMRMDGHEGINQIQKVIFEPHFTFVLFERSFGDLHSYVRNKRRLREAEAQTLFQQILQIVADCHQNGIVLRDLKLRKFIFANEEKTKLKLETLEGASIFEGDNDILTDKHGCPAYVSPEILYSNSYSGMAADCWSMGVILYTMLVGRYPFHDLNPSIVFVKIRRGTYDIPETLSKQARCLIRNLIRLEPEHRLTANDALAHRWFQEKWNINTKERIIQQHITNLHNFQHQQFLFQHSLSDLTVGPPPRAILTPSLIEGLLQLGDDQVVPTF